MGLILQCLRCRKPHGNVLQLPTQHAGAGFGGHIADATQTCGPKRTMLKDQLCLSTFAEEAARVRAGADSAARGGWDWRLHFRRGYLPH